MEVVYVTAKRIIELYEGFSFKKGIPFHINNSILSPDETTLFCTSGMQRYKNQFSDTTFKNTFSNSQTCLRLNDYEEIGDSTHFLVFHMLGFFSFREWELKTTIQFWIEFLNEININIDYVTIHPDKMNEWSKLYPCSFNIKEDNNCFWSDGSIGGYCTEFYSNNIEIGNIVNTLGTCIDVGFGCERLHNLIFDPIQTDRISIIKDTCLNLINSGITLSNNKQGYILKKLLTELVFSNESIEHTFFYDIKEKQILRYKKYLSMIKNKKYQKKPYEWWLDTLGIDLNDLVKYQKLIL